jgi:hypothetical protein
MRYWGYFIAKLVAVCPVILIAYRAVRFFFGKPVYIYDRRDPFTHDLTYTMAMLFFFLFSSGLVYLAIRDQRYRCRTCLRRLRMPLAAGSWSNMFLIGQPRMEHICIYGHGTLKVPEVELTGPKSPDWQPHEDIWKELESFEATRK